MDLFYRSPRLTALFLGLVLVAGLAAASALPRQEDPALTRRFANIKTFFPGASALRVESLVTEPLESKLQELHEIVELDSYSRTGSSVIGVEVDERLDQEAVDQVWSKVRDKLGDTVLPSGASVPEFEEGGSVAETLVVGLVWEGPGEPSLGILTRLAEELENRLRNLPGTRDTLRYGDVDEEIRVTVDPAELARSGVSAAELSRAIASADAKVPAGQLRGPGAELPLEVEGELDSLARIAAVPVRAAADGRMLRVGNLGRVERAAREPVERYAWIDGRRGVAVSAEMETDRRVDLWAERARRVVEAFRSEVPRGIALEVRFDQSTYTQARLSTLIGNLVLGASIVVAILIFMMGLRSALLVASALPLTVAMVLSEMHFLGVPLHQMSITGLIIALGLLIDNAIVVVDEFNLERRRGVAPADAVRATVGKLRVPLAASTFTTVLAFLPIALMPGGAGEFVGPIAIGVGLAVGSSFLLAMSVIPALAGRLGDLLPSGEPEARRFWREGFAHPTLHAAFRDSVALAVRHPWLGVAAALILPLLGFAVGTTLPEQFFPANDRNQFQVHATLSSSASIDESVALARAARELVHAHPEVVRSDWYVGESPPRVYYNMMAGQEGISAYAGGVVTTRSPGATERLLPGLQRELMDAFPEARVVALPFEQGPPFEAPIEVRVIGPDLDVLRALGDELRVVLAGTPAVTYTIAKLQGGRPKLVLQTDEDEARLAGLRLTDVAAELAGRLEGTLGGTVLEANQELPVRVRVGSQARASTERIVGARLLSGAGSPAEPDAVAGVPLAAISELRLVPELAGITRRNGERSNTVQAYLEPYHLISDALADFRARLDDHGFELPAGYRLELGGEDEQRSEAMSSLMASALPLFVIMFGAVILSFDSFRLAGVIFSVAFLAVGLALFGVWLFGYPFGFVAIVGTMGLVGLAINDAIVVLTALVHSPGARGGDQDAIVDVVVESSRHVIATTLTTIGGFTPLILFGGRFWPPMATAIAGGVFGCSILALFYVPALFRVMKGRSGRAKAPGETSAPARELSLARRGGRSSALPAA